MADVWTIRRVIQWIAQDLAARGMGSPRLDAELIVAHALGSDRMRLYLDLERPLEDGELAAIRALVARRRKFEPVAYLIGRREFFGRPFQVSPAVLIPRPDTETLVERALTILPKESEARVLDLCTGSGAIGISIAAERAGVRVDLTDLSEAAVAMARQNANALGVGDRVTAHVGDLFAAVAPGSTYALITANPPYIVDAEVPGLMADIAQHEPHLALAGGEDGLRVIREIVARAPDWLEAAGSLLVEVGAGQAPAVADLVRASLRYAGEARIHRDLAGIERVVEATRA